MMAKLMEGLNLQHSLVKDIMCQPHNQFAIFFSDQQKKYKCYLCLAEEQKLVLVNDNYQKHLEEFDRIKAKT